MSAGSPAADSGVDTGADENGNKIVRTVLPSFHYERIDDTVLKSTDAPLNIIGFNEFVPVLSYTSGSRIGATQLHPELTIDDVTAFIDFKAEIIKRFVRLHPFRVMK